MLTLDLALLLDGVVDAVTIPIANGIMAEVGPWAEAIITTGTEATETRGTTWAGRITGDHLLGLARSHMSLLGDSMLQRRKMP